MFTIFFHSVSFFFLKHHFQSFIGFPIVRKSPFHAVSWHSKMCFVALCTSSFWGFKQPINTKVPANLYLCGNLGVFCACAVWCCVPYPSSPASCFVYNQFSGKVSGEVVKNLNSDKVANSIFPLPPIEEQQRIVQRLEKLMPLWEKSV